MDFVFIITIKKFNIQLEAKAQSSFRTKCKTLGKIRYRNLVKIMGVVSNSNINILILQFMHTGILDMHLHENSTHIGWVMRLQTSVGVSLASVYLHEECGIGDIFHCNIKSPAIFFLITSLRHTSMI